MSTSGFLTTVIVGITVSLLTGGLRENRHLNDDLLSPLSRFLPPFQKPSDKSKIIKNGINKESNNNHNGTYTAKNFIEMMESEVEYIDADRAKNHL